MVRQFRCAQTRMNHMSEDAVKAGRQDNYDDFIKVDLDACDEAKFKCPRNTSNAKCLDWYLEAPIAPSWIFDLGCA